MAATRQVGKQCARVAVAVAVGLLALLAASEAFGPGPGHVPAITIARGVSMPLLGLGTGPPYTANETYTAALHAFAMGSVVPCPLCHVPCAARARP